jgi:hypothetical protein
MHTKPFSIHPTTYKIYICRYSTVIVKANTLEEANIEALQAYNAKGDNRVEHSTPEAEDYSIVEYGMTGGKDA